MSLHMIFRRWPLGVAIPTGQLRSLGVARLHTSCRGPSSQLRPASGHGLGPQPKPQLVSLQSSQALLRRYQHDGPTAAATKRQKKYYAVWKGWSPGLYTKWSGPNGALVQQKGFPGAMLQSYNTREEALDRLHAEGWTGQDAEGVARQQPTKLRASNGKASFSKGLGAWSSHALDTYLGALDDVQGGQDASGHSEPKASEELVLAKEQQDAIDLAVNHGCNVFVTGSGGCGKSVVVHKVREKLKEQNKRVYTLAPTGQAALQVDGRTTWAYAGWSPDSPNYGLPGLISRMIQQTKVRKRVKETEVLIIDEISMIENFHFTQLSKAIQAIRNDVSKPETWGPFGGIQLIVVGDFCQLPPVMPFKRCVVCGSAMEEWEEPESRASMYTCNKSERHGQYRQDDKWAFKSDQWELCKFEHIHLVKIHRQSHPEFIAALQKIRLGAALADEDLKLLLDHEVEAEEGVRLCSRRDKAALINQEKFSALQGETTTYESMDELVDKTSPDDEAERDMNQRQAESTWKRHRFDETVKLKIGMPVVLLSNVDVVGGFCNGSQGIIRGFTTAEVPPPPSWESIKANVPKAFQKEAWERAMHRWNQIDDFMRAKGLHNPIWPVVEFKRGRRTILPDCFVTELGFQRPYSLLLRTQVPLAPGWAMTIHKSQSLSLDRVTVDLASVFEGGQIYVALSRARTLQGLRIVGGDTPVNRAILRRNMKLDPQVSGFLRDKFPHVMANLAPPAIKYYF